MKATVYEPTTGQILRTVSAGRVEDFNANIGADESWIEGAYAAAEYYVKSGKACLKPSRPDGFVTFDYAKSAWAADDTAAAAHVRAERQARLAASDWTQAPDAPTDKPAWAAYRQALRDVTGQPGFPHSIIWPDPPR